MPKCSCRETQELIEELVESWINGNISHVIDEISEYNLPNAITLALEVYKTLPEANKEAFLNSFSIRE